MRTAIVYFSKHHNNTKKLLDAVSGTFETDLINAADVKEFDLSAYDMIGFASGIYYSKFHKSVIKFAEKNLPENKNVFFIYTYGVKKEGYTDLIEKTVLGKSATVLGEYGCLGFNTYGPFKLIGGIAKGHPDDNEVTAVKEFFEKCCDVTAKVSGV